MPRKAKPAELVEETQPPLFLDSQLPSLPQLTEAAKCYVHTGKITCKNEQRAADIATAFLETGQYLTVAKRFGISPNTVHAVVEVLERAGKLDDLKQRLSRKLGILAEVSAERAIQMVNDGKCPANVLPINVGVAIEKKALIDGEATQRVETVRSQPLDASDVLAYLRAKAIPAPAIDVQSTVVTREAQQLEGKP